MRDTIIYKAREAAFALRPTYTPSIGCKQIGPDCASMFGRLMIGSTYAPAPQASHEVDGVLDLDNASHFGPWVGSRCSALPKASTCFLPRQSQLRLDVIDEYLLSAAKQMKR